MSSVMESALREIDALSREDGYLLIAIDGRCASGKSTLASQLKEHFGCNVIPMDHFFLQPHQRTAERIGEPGGNVDHERFFAEALTPLMRRVAFSYRPYDCQNMRFADPIAVMPHRINVIEGAYSCHPSLYEHYNLRIFLSVDKAEQQRRIIERNGAEAFAVFKERWIPLEEQYFSVLRIQEKCELSLNT